MSVVSNTTPLIGLAQIRRFELLQQLFGEIYIPLAGAALVVLRHKVRS
jgi:predicted nucleic acid-binding protein